MDRVRIGGDAGKDVESQGEEEMHRSSKSGKSRMYRYIVHSAALLLFLGTLAGLVSSAVQYRVAVGDVGRVGEVRKFISKSVKDRVSGESPKVYILPMRAMKGTEGLGLGVLTVRY